MKKLVLISTLVASLAGLSAFGQGYFNFSGNKSAVWDGTGSTDVRDSLLTVAFMWAPAAETTKVGTDTTLQTSGVALAGVPNTMNSGNSIYQASAAWADILSDPNFVFGLDANTSSSLVAYQLTLTTGGYQFIGQPPSTSSFGVAGTSSATTYSIYEVAWSGGYATPSLAEAGHAYVGWSTVLQYTFLASTASPNTPVWTQMAVAGLVPEPSTLVLAGLGGLSLLLFRRRK
jgi:hypothetical protein